MEVLVVLAIVGILAAVIVGNYRAYERQNVVENLAQDIALTIKLAQSYGLNVRGSDFESSYGVSFNDATPTSYKIYRDNDRGPIFTSLLGATDLEVFSIGQGYVISDICGLPPAAAEDCTMSRMDITFDRPNPDANFRDNSDVINYDEVRIRITGPGGDSKDIRVRATGFVSVQ